MKKSKTWKIWLITGMLMVSPLSSMNIMASQTLDQVTSTTAAPTVAETVKAVGNENTTDKTSEKSTEKSTEKGTENKKPVKTTSGSFIDDLSKAADLSEPSEEAAQVGAAMAKYGRIIFQVAGYVISIGMGIMIALDVVYIVVTPLRSLLANGYVGNPVDNASQQQQAISGMGGMNGMNGGMGGGYGGGGYGGGYGQGRFGSSGGMNNMGQATQGIANQNQPARGRTQWVSNAALNAVATESTGVSPFKAYVKDQVIMCVCAPLILLLASTGVLAHLGFALGGALSKALANMSSGL